MGQKLTIGILQIILLAFFIKAQYMALKIAKEMKSLSEDMLNALEHHFTEDEINTILANTKQRVFELLEKATIF